jgi:hypothetical protein
VALGRKKSRAPKRSERAKIDATPPWETRVRDEPRPTAGPYDVRDAPDDGIARADLGALRIPVGARLNLQVEVNEQQQVVSASLTSPVSGTMQIGLFAAPRNEGIWDEVRTEIADSMSQQRGKPVVREGGAFGTELTGTLPAEGGRAPVRFIGVDGPRWFLRAMLVGAAADPARAAEFEDAFRQIVVVRGTDPLPVRDPVPLTLPKDALPGEADGAEGGDVGGELGGDGNR